MYLVLPSLKYEKSYTEALEESKNETGETLLNRLFDDESFENFVNRLNSNAKGLNLPENYVTATTFWLIDKNELIGRLHIRHELTEYLLKYGGHIGFYIRPSKRRMGYGTKILGLGLKKAEKIGLSKILITCDDDNIGSRYIIEKNNGTFENIINQGDCKIRRYWINI